MDVRDREPIDQQVARSATILPLAETSNNDLESAGSSRQRLNGRGDCLD